MKTWNLLRDLRSTVSFDWTVLRLLQDGETATEVARYVRKVMSPAEIEIGRYSMATFDFMASPVDPDGLIEDCADSRRFLGMAYYVLAMNTLARGDRDALGRGSVRKRRLAYQADSPAG